MKKLTVIIMAASLIGGTISFSACSGSNEANGSSSSAPVQSGSSTEAEKKTDSSAETSEETSTSEKQDKPDEDSTSEKQEKSGDNGTAESSSPIDLSVPGRMQTLQSITKLQEHLYKVSYSEDYHLDSILSADIRSASGLLNYMNNELFGGKSYISSRMNKYACSAYLSTTADGKHIAGRNMDHNKSDVLVVYSQPEKGYASYGTVSLDMLGVGGDNLINADSDAGKACMLASPFACLDGMNEKGLDVSILNLDEENEIHQDEGKPDLLISVAVRLLLDRAATVDEALKLLSEYDIHTTEGTIQHLFICDKSGKAVVVEWTKNEMKVTQSNACTNFELSAQNGDYKGLCDRFDTITDRLSAKGVNSMDDGMKLLSDVSMSSGLFSPDFLTVWSCVYDLDNFKMNIAIHLQFDKVSEITR